MKFDFNFKTINDEKEVRETVDFIRKFPLDYRGYMDWTEKVNYQLLNAEKQGIIVYSEKKIVGDLIFQECENNCLELKNMRVYDNLSRRGFGNFMLSQLEVEALNLGVKGIVLDTRVENNPIRNLLNFRGYEVVSESKLYDEKIDVSYFKKLK